MDAREQFKAAIAAAGLPPPDTIIADGKIHDFSTNGRPKDDAGRYKFYDDERPSGWFKCHRSGIEATWTADTKREFTAEERAAWKAKMRAQELERAADAERVRQAAAAKAAELWNKAKPANGHDYLSRKGIDGEAAGQVARELDGELLVPVKHSARELVGLQRIKPSGDKRFLIGTPAGGGYMTIGKTGEGPVAIVEGFATGMSVHLATGWCVVVAFNAGNLDPVAKKIRAAMKDTELIIAGDDDAFTAGNPGLAFARKAAEAVNARLAVPQWAYDRGTGTDFNDLHQAEGLEAVAACIAQADRPQFQDFADPAAAEIIDPNTGEILAERPERHLIFSTTPMTTAELFRESLPADGRIVFWREEFYQWTGHRYSQREKTAIHQQLYHWMASCLTERVVDKKTGATEVVAFSPRTSVVEDVMHALRAVCFIEVQEPPTWLEQEPSDPPVSELVAFRNGFLNLKTRALTPSTSRLFITSALDFDYDPHAKRPEHWHDFLAGLWPQDLESRDALADVFGYMLTDDTSLQKMFMLIGPPRCGKGTILRILESMVGPHNRVSPSLAGIGTQFGLQPLIGKRVAMISDARLSGKSDQQPIVENMLRISGEDSVSIDRKNKEAWTGKLPTRFVLASNELPAFSDASAALANRFVLFKFTQSFLGKEDPGLTSRLLGELPGIVLWALDGLERLRVRGYLQEPAASRETAQELREQTSPISVFVAEKCILSEHASCDRGELFAAWREWCTTQGRDHSGTIVHFGRHLNAAFPSIGRSQPREGGTRISLYTGIRLRRLMDRDDDNNDRPF